MFYDFIYYNFLYTKFSEENKIHGKGNPKLGIYRWVSGFGQGERFLVKTLGGGHNVPPLIITKVNERRQYYYRMALSSYVISGSRGWSVQGTSTPTTWQPGSSSSLASYRDRRVERQRRWPEALYRRLATLPISEFFHFRMRYLRHSFFGGVLRFL